MRVDEQIRGMRPDKSVLMSASAGSGKTHVLVGRIVHLLAAGLPPEALAAITFTDKAAAQMKDRLYGSLAAAAWDGTGVAGLLGLSPRDIPYPLKKTPEEIFSGLTARHDAMKVGTIHAFCLGLLKQFPFEAGLPAGFRVMDETEMLMRRDRAADDCIGSLEGKLYGEFTLLSDAGYNQRRMKELLVSALDKRGILNMLAEDHGGPEKLIARMEEGIGAGIKVDGGLTDKADEVSTLLRGHGIQLNDYILALDGLAKMRAPDELPGVFERLAGHLFTKSHADRKRSPVTAGAAEEALRARRPSLKGGELKEMARELVERHNALYQPLRDGVRGLAGLYDETNAGRALTAFMRLYGKAEEIYASLNLRDGLADYDDLEIYTYRLLSRPGAMDVLYRVEAKVLHYLVDEFQDTGLLQWGILSRLNSEAFAGQGAEGLFAPTLFAVGDKKQSIYRFRKADYRLMDRLRRKMEAGIEAERRDFPELGLNFRSAPEVMDVVDETFAVIFGDGYRASGVARTDARGSVKLRVVPLEQEAGALADEVEAALGLPVRDASDGALRAAGYGDMAVLLRSRAGLKAYEEALRTRGIPFKVVGGVGFFYQEEVQALIGLLGYLENPADLLSLAAALKSPLFRLSDGDIEPLYKSPEPVEALREVSPEAHRLITAWREDAGVVPPGRLVETIIRDSSALFAFGVSGGPAAALNIEKLTGIARDFDRRGGVGLSEFMDWVEAYREKSDLATADVELPGYERFVSVMTVHAAKGLEFPVVFLPGAARGIRKPAGRLLLGTGGDDGVRMAVRTDALLGDAPRYSILKEEEDRERVDEAARLLYVAMTRARDHLVILAGSKTAKRKGKAPDGETWLGMLFEAMPRSLFGRGPEPDGLPALYVHPERPPVAVMGPGGAARENAGCPVIEPPEAGRLRKIAGEGGVTFETPSGQAGRLREDDGPGRPYPARLRGDLIHAALEEYVKDGEGRCDIKALARRAGGFALLGKGAKDALLKDVERTLGELLSDERFKGLLSPGPGKYTELQLLVKRGDVITSGRADLVIIDGDKARVVDYKTGLIKAAPEDIKAEYARQLSAYCDAVKEAFGLGAAEPLLLLIDRRELISL